jgi:hypothetical protein
MTDITALKKYAEERHQQVLSMIETFSDTTDSVKGSLVWKVKYFELLGDDFTTDKQSVFRVTQQVGMPLNLENISRDLFISQL